MSSIRIQAPELPSDLSWFNTPEPVTLASQRGKVLLLNFWTAGCIYSQQVLHDLNYLQQKFADGLTVLGVHVPRYPFERDARHMREIIQRERIQFPVVNDYAYRLWKQFRMQRWPAVVFVEPEGYILGVLTGPNRRQQLEGLIREQLLVAEQKKIRQYSTLLTPVVEPLSTLRFPGRVLATETRLYISDSGNNRVVEATLTGRVTRQFGSKTAGFLDGIAGEALFNNPQGMAKISDFLYVADTGNHAIRRIHLLSGEVYTVIGDGRVGTLSNRSYGDPAIAQPNAPWGLAYHDGSLYITMAGFNQIWRWQLGLNHLAPWIGSGQRGIRDGLPEHAQFAQPCGIAASEFAIYIADSESSAVRSVRMPDALTATLVGKPSADFGDIDGINYAARLQRPLDIAYDDKHGILWICDTYNNKLKYFRFADNQVKSLDVLGLECPGGICWNNNILWVANTNAHEIRRLDLVQGTSIPIQIEDDNTDSWEFPVTA